LLGLTFFRFIYIYFIPITPQEAYYWYYSQNPAWSYFDHPPMTAWSIWLGTYLFGDNVFGVKFMGVIWSLLTNILLYKTSFKFLSKHSGQLEPTQSAQVMAFMVVVLYNLTLFAHIYAITIMPDTPLLFFWMAVIYFVQEWRLTGKTINWIAAGLALGFGLVSKYTAIAIVPGIFVWLLLSREGRRQLLSPWPYAALILAAVIFSPVVYWNAGHEWASFIFQFGDRARNVKSIGTRYVGQLFSSQLLLLTPFIFILFITAVIKTMRNFRRSYDLSLFYLSGIFIIAGFIMVSLKSLVKMNWLLPGYPGLMITSMIVMRESLFKNGRWIKTGYLSSVILIGLAHMVLLIPNLPLAEGNTWSGWPDASRRVHEVQKEAGGQERCFLFTNSYKSASLLKFYIPGQQDVYCQNVYGQPALQFEFWPLPADLSGKDALYIFDNRKEYKNDLEKIRPYFQSVELNQTWEYTFMDKIPVRTIYCYYARNYQPPAK